MYTFELCLIGIYVFDAEGVRKIDILENPKLIFLRTQQLPKSTEMGGEKKQSQTLMVIGHKLIYWVLAHSLVFDEIWSYG